MKLSPNQRRLLQYVRKMIRKNGYAPSYREIAKDLEYTSIATVALHIDSLVEAGYLRKTYNKRRTLEVIGDDEVMLKRIANKRLETATEMETTIIREAMRLLGVDDL